MSKYSFVVNFCPRILVSPRSTLKPLYFSASSYKPATLNNGLSIQVPPFIESGDEVIIDTRNLEYVKKN